jgi:hypothetical protein
MRVGCAGWLRTGAQGILKVSLQKIRADALGIFAAIKLSSSIIVIASPAGARQSRLAGLDRHSAARFAMTSARARAAPWIRGKTEHPTPGIGQLRERSDDAIHLSGALDRFLPPLPRSR